MTIAVVGARGFIGSALARLLLVEGHDLRLIGRGDDFDFSGCDFVYHCAGVTGGGQFLQADPLGMVGPNIRLALDVFDAAKRDGVGHVIAMSSTTGYPDHDHPLHETEYFEGEVHPVYINPGETRRYIERLGAMYPFATTFIRCAGAYGPGDDYSIKTSHVIGATIRKIAERHDPLICWGDGEDSRDGTYIDDLARALVAAIEPDGSRAFNIGSGEAMTIKEMIAVLADHAGYRPRVLHDLSKPRMIRSRMLDTDRAHAALMWWPKVPMEKGLRMALDAYAGR